MKNLLSDPVFAKRGQSILPDPSKFVPIDTPMGWLIITSGTKNRISHTFFDGICRNERLLFIEGYPEYDFQVSGPGKNKVCEQDER